MFGLRKISLLIVAVCIASSSATGVFAQSTATRNLRAQHDGPHAADGSPLSNTATATVTGNMNTMTQMPVAAASAPGTVSPAAPAKVKSPGGLLGPLYAAFPNLMKPIALISDTIHNSNAALTGVQHTPDGIFQA